MVCHRPEKHQAAVVVLTNKKYFVHEKTYPSTKLTTTRRFQSKMNVAFAKGHSTPAFQCLPSNDAHVFTTSNAFMNVSSILSAKLILVLCLPFHNTYPSFLTLYVFMFIISEKLTTPSLLLHLTEHTISFLLASFNATPYSVSCFRSFISASSSRDFSSSFNHLITLAEHLFPFSRFYSVSNQASRLYVTIHPFSDKLPYSALGLVCLFCILFRHLVPFSFALCHFHFPSHTLCFEAHEPVVTLPKSEVMLIIWFRLIFLQPIIFLVKRLFLLRNATKFQPNHHQKYSVFVSF